MKKYYTRNGKEVTEVDFSGISQHGTGRISGRLDGKMEFWFADGSYNQFGSSIKDLILNKDTQSKNARLNS